MLSIKKSFVTGVLLISSVFFLSACGSSRESVGVEGLPELFAHMPDGYDQMLYMEIDEKVSDLVQQQYPESPELLAQFEKLESLAIRQRGEAMDGETLLFVQGAGVDIAGLTDLGLVVIDPNYTTKQITDDIQMYGLSTLVESKQLGTLGSDELLGQVDQLLRRYANFVFVSRPSTTGLVGFAGDFAQQLEGTVGAFELGPQMPRGEARMLFDKGFVPELTEDREGRVLGSNAPISLVAHGLTSLVGIESGFGAAVLPMFLGQILGGSASLMTDVDYERLMASLGGSLALEAIPSLFGMGGRLTLDDPALYDTFQKVQPALNQYIQSIAFSGTVLTPTITKDLMSRTAPVPVGTGGAASEFPVVEIRRQADATSIGFMVLEETVGPISTQRKRYPGSTLAVARLDTQLLGALTAADTSQITGGGGTLDITMIADHEQDVVRLVVE